MAFDLERLNSLSGRTSSGTSPGGRRPPRDPRDGRATTRTGAAGGRPAHSLGWDASLVHELGHFLTAIAGGTPAAPLGATFEDGYRCAVVCDAILEAARTGRRVAIGD